MCALYILTSKGCQKNWKERFEEHKNPWVLRKYHAVQCGWYLVAALCCDGCVALRCVALRIAFAWMVLRCVRCWLRAALHALGCASSSCVALVECCGDAWIDGGRWWRVSVVWRDYAIMVIYERFKEPQRGSWPTCPVAPEKLGVQKYWFWVAVFMFKPIRW